MNLNYNDGQAGIGQTERQALDVLSRLGKPTIRAHDLETTHGYSREISNLMLSRLCKKGWVQRLKSGIYRIVPLGSESANPVPEDAGYSSLLSFTSHTLRRECKKTTCLSNIRCRKCWIN